MYFPEMNTILKIKEPYTIAPVCKELFADEITPITLLRKIASQKKSYFLLESVEGGTKWGRYSFLGFDPKMSLHLKDYNLTIKEENVKQIQVKDPYLYLREILDKYKSPTFQELPPFTGGFLGNFSYNMIQYAEPVLNLKKVKTNDFDLMLLDKVIAYDHLKQKMLIIVNMRIEDGMDGYQKACNQISEIEKSMKNMQVEHEQINTQNIQFEKNISDEACQEKIDKIKQHIIDGDIFQAVLSRKFETVFPHSLIQVYRMLRTTNPSPYMFYVKMDELTYVGTSPETLIKLRDGTLTTFPVAGTRKRGRDETEDREIERGLLADEKELAEHNMLVDLARNDIGKVSNIGTVEVEKYMEIHRYSKVMHIASIVTGKIREDKDAFDALSAMVPAGTLSGAPKIRACEIINELEPDAREIYGGAVGYIDFSGNMDTCIAIRMALKQGDKLTVQAGAGIVFDSDSQSECLEMEHKAGAVMEAVKRSGEVANL